MTEETKVALTATKVANIIQSLRDLYNIPYEEATDIYFNTVTSDLIEDGISDLQCRSDKYLATSVWDEYQETN